MSADITTHPNVAPTPFGPIPSARQLRWHEREFYGFLHFTTNTFTDKEWGFGDEQPDVFAPTSFDPEQIAFTAADAGMSALILTCKHHDGFCLWPSKYTEHSVKNSKWKNGDGDVVREISDACRRHNVDFGVYLSPWDRNHSQYGTPEYIRYFRNQLEELTSEYGELFEVWFDGANGGDGYYGGACETRRIDRCTYYDWQNTREIVRKNQPNAVMFSDAGPDVRWVGNELGIAGDPCWATINADILYPGINSFNTEKCDDMVAAWGSPFKLLNAGDRNGNTWLPGECDLSIRPGWFYHATEDEQVKTPEELYEIYCCSVGRGASMLLNIPPDRRGMIHENDIASLKGFRHRLDRIFSNDFAQKASFSANNRRADLPDFDPSHVADGKRKTYWATDDDTTAPELTLTFPSPVTFNTVSLREYLPLGQRVDKFAVDVDRTGSWQEWCLKSAIGSRRIVQGNTSTTSRIRLRILDTPVCPAISEFGIFHDPSYQ